MSASLLSFVAALFFTVPPAKAHAIPAEPDFSQVSCWTWASVIHDFGQGCFEWYGDEFWAQDTESDGFSAVLHWESAFGLGGTCRNSQGAGTWKKCDGTDYISEQDDVRWWMCLTDGPTAIEYACTTDPGYFPQPKSCWVRADNGRQTPSCNTPRSTASPVASPMYNRVNVRADVPRAEPTAAADTSDCTYWLAAGNWGDSCFVPNGDISMVSDRVHNDWIPVLLVETSYQENPGDGGNKTRTCVHQGFWEDPEASDWTACNYDHRETHCVRWWIYEQKIDTGLTRNYVGPTPWLGVDDGRPGNCVIE